jgi:uncharacterized membrane protein YbjE (DUF340 family)
VKNTIYTYASWAVLNIASFLLVLLVHGILKELPRRTRCGDFLLYIVGFNVGIDLNNCKMREKVHNLRHYQKKIQR